MRDRWRFRVFGDESALKSGCALSLGNFDGVHLGHQHLLGEMARSMPHLPTCVLTFAPHPAEVLSGAKIPLLCGLDERVLRLQNAGAQAVVVQTFSREFSELLPSEFCGYLDQCFRPKSLMLGFDFRFGKGRAGDVNTLRAEGEKFGWSVAQALPFSWNGRPVSSSRVREALATGDVADAGELLGRRFSLHGLVVKGDQRGRTLGFPTLNLAMPEERCCPRAGVYAGYVRFPARGEVHWAVMSLGLRPTFGDHLEFRIEAHVLDFERMAYGETVEFHFESRLRNEQKFASVGALVAQMRRDVELAKELLGRSHQSPKP